MQPTLQKSNKNQYRDAWDFIFLMYTNTTAINNLHLSENASISSDVKDKAMNFTDAKKHLQSLNN